LAAGNPRFFGINNDAVAGDGIVSSAITTTFTYETLSATITDAFFVGDPTRDPLTATNVNVPRSEVDFAAFLPAPSTIRNIFPQYEWLTIFVPDNLVHPPPPPPPLPPPPVATADVINQQDSPYDASRHYTSIFHAPVFGEGLLGNDQGNVIRVSDYDHQTKNGGTIAIGTAGNYIYAPNQLYYGDNDATTADDFFSYTITDSAGQTSHVTDAIFITPIQTYINKALVQAADDAKKLADFDTLSQKLLAHDDDIFRLANEGLAALQHEKLLFLAVEGLGRLADKINPGIGLITEAVKAAVTEPPASGEPTLSLINTLLTTVVDDFLEGGSAGHVSSVIIGGLNKAAKKVGGNIANQNAVGGLQQISDTITSLTNSRDAAVADEAAIASKLDGFRTAAGNSQSYLDAYRDLQSHVILPSF
jgi:hypothetical protein